MSDNDSIKSIPGAIEGAFVAIIAQNAFLASKAIANAVSTANIRFIQLVIMSIVLINSFTVAANWLESIQTYKTKISYTKAHMFWDLLILATLFVLTQSLIEISGKKFEVTEIQAFQITGAVYLVLGFLYIVWNKVELRSNERVKTDKEKDLLDRAIVLNYIAVLLSILMVTSATLLEIMVARATFIVWVLYWFYVFIYYIRQNELFIRGQ
jgi:hypothetical protein